MKIAIFPNWLASSEPLIITTLSWIVKMKLSCPGILNECDRGRCIRHKNQVLSNTGKKVSAAWLSELKKGTKLDQNLGGKLSAGAAIHCLLSKKTKGWQNKELKSHYGGIPFSGSQMNCIKLCQWGKINIRMVQRSWFQNSFREVNFVYRTFWYIGSVRSNIWWT